MCLIIFAINEHPDYPLILAANRDEYFDRPSEYVHPWAEAGEVIAGRDQIAGGTWLGITKNGRLAAITNYRNPSGFRSGAPSRGLLTAGYLKGNMAPEVYIDAIRADGNTYNGYNLLLSDTPEKMIHYSNVNARVTKMRTGIHGLSNHLLDTPWPKVERGIRKFRTVLRNKSVDPKQLFEIMRDRSQAPDDQLPSTGIDRKLERRLSSIFIRIPGYGTRCTTVLTVDRHHHVTFEEHSYDATGREINQSRFTFYIDT